jgi:hypothetical protein
MFLLFLVQFIIALDFLPFQVKHNVRTLLVNNICTGCTTGILYIYLGVVVVVIVSMVVGFTTLCDKVCQ